MGRNEELDNIKNRSKTEGQWVGVVSRLAAGLSGTKPILKLRLQPKGKTCPPPIKDEKQLVRVALRLATGIFYIYFYIQVRTLVPLFPLK
jgi:hypothetical protein